MLFLFFIFIHTYLIVNVFFHISFCNTNLHFYFSEICKYCVIKLYVNDIYVLTKRKRKNNYSWKYRWIGQSLL